MNVFDSRLALRRVDLTNNMLQIIEGRYQNSWTKMFEQMWSFDIINGKRKLLVVVKNSTKLLLVLLFTFFLSNFNPALLPSTEMRDSDRLMMELSATLLLGVVFASDCATLIYVCARLAKIGRGCCNRRAISGRMSTQRNRDIEYKFRWYEFLGPVSAMLSNVNHLKGSG